MFKIFTISFLFFIGLSVNAQNFIVSGFVRDKATGEREQLVTNMDSSVCH